MHQPLFSPAMGNQLSIFGFEQPAASEAGEQKPALDQMVPTLDAAPAPDLQPEMVEEGLEENAAQTEPQQPESAKPQHENELAEPVQTAIESAHEDVVDGATGSTEESEFGNERMSRNFQAKRPTSRLEILAPEPRPKLPEPTPKQPAKRGRKPLKSVALQLDELSVPPDEELFSKQYYPAGTVAGWLNIGTPLLRTWSKEFGAVLKPRKNRKGDRLYQPEEVKKLVLIHQLLRERKYSMEGARQYLTNHKEDASAQQQIYESLTRFRAFLLALKANLGA